MAAFAQVTEDGCIVVAEGAHYRYRTTSAEVVCDLTDGVAEADALDRFHRTIVPLLLASRGWTVLHASSVQIDERAVIFMAPSTTGKSTTAYALGKLGLAQMGDDAAVLDVADGSTRLWPIPFQPRLRHAAIGKLGEPQPVTNIGRSPLPVAGLFVLERTDAASPGLLSLSQAESLGLLMTNALAFDLRDSASRRRMVAGLTDVIAGCPLTARLLLPNSIAALDELPQLLAEHLPR